MSYLLGLIGHPVQHSLSAAMHKAALADSGLPGDYKLLDVDPDRLPQELPGIIEQGFCGLNVTIPHKENIVSLCAQLTPEAAQARAVNTLKLDAAGNLEGHNTDVGGFMSALSEALPVSVRRSVACVMGSGGAARAAVWGLAYLGWQKIQVVARNSKAAEKLSLEVQQSAPKDPSQSWPQIYVLPCNLSTMTYMPDLLVNATPIGLDIDEPPEWTIDLLKCMDPHGVFFDLVYSSDGRTTPLIAAAGRLRISCVDGTDMLVQQAALSFKYWTGKRGPVETMKRALLDARQRRQQELRKADK